MPCELLQAYDGIFRLRRWRSGGTSATPLKTLRIIDIDPAGSRSTSGSGEAKMAKPKEAQTREPQEVASATLSTASDEWLTIRSREWAALRRARSKSSDHPLVGCSVPQGAWSSARLALTSPGGCQSSLGPWRVLRCVCHGATRLGTDPGGTCRRSSPVAGAGRRCHLAGSDGPWRPTFRTGCRRRSSEATAIIFVPPRTMITYEPDSAARRAVLSSDSGEGYHRRINAVLPHLHAGADLKGDPQPGGHEPARGGDLGEGGAEEEGGSG